MTADRAPRRHVVVTGAGSGIGRATAQALLGDGQEVTAIDLSESVVELEAAGARAVVADVTDEAARSRIAAEAGAVHGLVNAAGIIRVAELEDVTVADWRAMFGVNVEALFFLTQALLPNLADGGAIVNLSSMSAKMSDDASAAYSASKAAVATITRAFAARLGPRGIRVNSVSPGVILTRMQDDFLAFYAARSGMTEEGFQEGRFDTIPLRRGGSAEDCANVIRFLLSDDAAYVTGADVNITGGMVTW
jgi:NAD(P)-dependent dehydrogenase (short-subunit alcohol dehydrogenase family)